MKVSDLPKDTYEREAFLEKYVVGKSSAKAIEELNLHLGRIVRGKGSSPYGREIAAQLESMDREEFSAWYIDYYARY